MKVSASFCIMCGKENASMKKPLEEKDISAAVPKEMSVTSTPPPRIRRPVRRIILIAIPVVLALTVVGTAIVFARQIIGNRNDTEASDNQNSPDDNTDSDANERGSSSDETTDATTDATTDETTDATTDETADEAAQTAAGAVAFIQNTLQLPVGSATDLNSYLTTNLSEDELIWSSDKADQVSVDNKGNIKVLTSGASAIIMVKSAQESAVLSSICVTSLSLEAENFVEKVTSMNNGIIAAMQIDIYSALYKPAARNKTLKWDSSIFYSLEDVDKTKTGDGLINSYYIEKKQLTNAATGNLIEYEIYRNPNSGLVNKITSIEHMPDTTLEIMEYYYTDAGQINFIFAHKDTIYTPSYASPDKHGERFYFNADVMVKWRIVDNAQVLTDYAIGTEEQHNSTTSADAQIYDNVSTDIQLQYDAKEIAMINAAYNTFNVVIKAQSSRSITGHITDAAGFAIADSKVVLYSVPYTAELCEIKTGQDGAYQFYVPSDVHTYKISIQKDGYVNEELYQIEMTDQIIDLYQENVCMVVDDGSIHSTQVLVTDALNVSDKVYADGFDSKMQRLSNATVNFRAGINNRTGVIYSTVNTNSDGIADVNLASGNYTAEIISDGYASSFGTIVANADNLIAQISTSPVLTGDEIRIVLTWGAVPADLDSHLFTPYNEADSTTGYHIWFRNLFDASGNNLDVDDITGYGPETVTISALSDGLYKYYVADYTNCSVGMTTSTDMSFSSVKVSVYTQDGLSATFYVPGNQSGVIWEVFEIRNKVIVPIQRYYTNIDDKPWWNTDK